MSVELSPELQALKAEMHRLAKKEYAGNSQRAYATGWRQFADWCVANGLHPLPADGETVALFITSLTRPRPAGRNVKEGDHLSPNTVRARLAAIAHMHAQRKEPMPDLRMAHRVITSYRRERSDEGWQERRVDPLLRQDLLKIRDCLDWSLPISVRDWAILMLGVAGMARREELSCLDLSDLSLEEPFLNVRVCSSKTDQAGLGHMIPIPRGQDHTLCPVRAVLAWVQFLTMKGKTEGPLFRSMDNYGKRLLTNGNAISKEALKGRLMPQGISDAYQRCADLAGLEGDFAGHSGRAGGVTSAHLEGVGLIEISDHGRFVRGSKALYRYVRGEELRANNPMSKVF